MERDEIIKEAIERGLDGESIYITEYGSTRTGVHIESHSTNPDFWHYEKWSGSLWSNGKGLGGILLYNQGNWATLNDTLTEIEI